LNGKVNAISRNSFEDTTALSSVATKQHPFLGIKLGLMASRLRIFFFFVLVNNSSLPLLLFS